MSVVVSDLVRLRDALATVAAGRAYQREHYPEGHPGKFVGRIPAEEYDEALDIIVALTPAWLREPGEEDDLCRNCGRPIRRDVRSPTGWTHGRWPSAPEWQGKRCPRRLTGAEPIRSTLFSKVSGR